MIVHTLKMCTDDAGPEQSLVLFEINIASSGFPLPFPCHCLSLHVQIQRGDKGSGSPPPPPEKLQKYRVSL